MGVAWSPQRRARMQSLARSRAGAPTGFGTVYGIHVPAEHCEPVRYFASRLRCRHGRTEAEQFVRGLQADGWSAMPRWRDLWQRRVEIDRSRRIVKLIRMELGR